MILKMKHILVAWLLAISTLNVLSFRSMPSHAFGTAKPSIQSWRHPSSCPLHATVPTFADRFGKWKFLRDLLDGDIEGDVINRLLYSVLSNYLKNPPAAASQDAQGSPQLTPQLVARLEEVLETARDHSFTLFAKEADDKLVEKFENLLPDPLDDEDAHKSTWDTVLEIHGRDMVKANEMNATTEWRKLCLTARLLIHYDFLSRSVEV